MLPTTLQDKISASTATTANFVEPHGELMHEYMHAYVQKRWGTGDEGGQRAEGEVEIASPTRNRARYGLRVSTEHWMADRDRMEDTRKHGDSESGRKKRKAGSAHD
jgi:hypothetical protein